jgi:thioredoxin-dependent peroxiredoxin
MAETKLKGSPIHTNADLPKVGSSAPDFKLTAADLSDHSLADFKGKKKLLNIFPSIDTPVCAMSTKKFNDAAAKHGNAVMIMISADLPFAMARFCGAENTNTVKTLSMMRDRHFAKDYGVLLTDGPLAGITARAVVVLDENNKVLYTELVPDITQEPNYEKALAALK